jgi:integrase
VKPPQADAFDSGDDAGSSPPAASGLLAKLMAVVRPEFRSEELVFDPEGVVFGGALCAVVGCTRTGRVKGLCWGHHNRWARAGKRDLEEFIASTDPRWRRQAGYLSCRASGCCFGRRCEAGLCPVHHRAWTRAGRPDLTPWLATLPEPTQQPPICQVTSCRLWVHQDSQLCWRHTRHWNRRGRPDIQEYADGFDLDPTPGHERVDLRELGPQLRLEMQYVLQRRYDQATTKTRPVTVRTVVRLLADSSVTCLLERPEHAWQQQLRDRANRATTAHAFLLYAYHQVSDLAAGTGWEVEYPRDVWRLRSIGIDKPQAVLRFDRIAQPWLKDLAKRWARWELSTATSPDWVHTGVSALTRFGRFIASPTVGVDRLAGVDRPVLERYLADLAAELGGREIHRQHIGRLNTFLHTIRRHRWDDSLPVNAMFFPEDYPSRTELLPRALAEHVMTQVEHPDNLDRWDNPAYRLITIILMRCGLRISDACKLPFDCIVTDADGAPYLRYHNHKMKREALVPIDEQLAEMITARQRSLCDRWPPTGTPVLFPRPSKNPDGREPTHSSTYRTALYRWLVRCDIRDEHALPVVLKPHQWRHTLGTRMINRDAPQEVVRRILDHESTEMTGLYARLSDTTIRRHWESARKVNANGETVTLDPDGPLAEAAWAKQRLSRATQALPNGYCGLPLVQTCPHANSCLTCPMFITTPEFLPHHRAHREQTLQIISAAETRGQTRMAEMNRQVADNLQKIITVLGDDGPDQQQEPAVDAS